MVFYGGVVLFVSCLLVGSVVFGVLCVFGISPGLGIAMLVDVWCLILQKRTR